MYEAQRLLYSGDPCCWRIGVPFEVSFHPKKSPGARGAHKGHLCERVVENDGGVSPVGTYLEQLK
jgi:hypothetical protein